MITLRGDSVNQLEIADDFYAAYKRCFEANASNEIVAIPGFVNGFLLVNYILKY